MCWRLGRGRLLLRDLLSFGENGTEFPTYTVRVNSRTITSWLVPLQIKTLTRCVVQADSLTPELPDDSMQTYMVQIRLRPTPSSNLAERETNVIDVYERLEPI
jgi:hypothetical protein